VGQIYYIDGAKLWVPAGAKPPTCDHGVTFDEEAAKDLSVAEIRKRWPRKWVDCAECGFRGIAYASYAHYIYGDW
jgi:hypothetical protein